MCDHRQHHHYRLHRHMLETLLSAAGGGIFGLIGSGVKLFMAYKDRKLKNEHEVNMAKETRLNMSMEIELAKSQGAIDLELQESDADAKGLQAAINAESSITDTSQWVADLRGSTRPFLTYSLVIGSFVIIVASPNNPWTNEWVFMSMTAVTFWFGDRPLKK